MDGIARIEAACGTGIVKILGRLTDGDLTTTEMCNILHPIIKGGGNDISMKDIQNAVWDAGLAETMKAVGEIIAVSLSGGNDEGNVKKVAKQ
tara:strand:- start:401 stop:676 length:276 start_codon:yes stop_codon:yes gene_type:complete